MPYDVKQNYKPVPTKVINVLNANGKSRPRKRGGGTTTVRMYVGLKSYNYFEWKTLNISWYKQFIKYQ